MTRRQRVLKLADKLGVWVTVLYRPQNRREIWRIELDLKKKTAGHFKANRRRRVVIELFDGDTAADGWEKTLVALKEGIE